jgi:hypothetical protein
MTKLINKTFFKRFSKIISGLPNERNNCLKFIVSFLILALSINGAWGQTIIFSENMGNPNGNKSIAASTFQNSGILSYSGTADTRTTLPSTGYSDASGDGNVFFTNSSGTYFQIGSINTTGYSSLQLSFGMYKSTTTSNGSELIVEVSADGINYNPLSFTIATGTGTAVWHLITPTGTIPSTSDLRIRFRTTTTELYFRIDDVKLTGIPSSDATLASLAINPGVLSPSFNTSTLTYATTLENSTNSITIIPTLNQSNASIEVIKNSENYPLTDGSFDIPLNLLEDNNTVDVKVTAQDGITIKTYTINVTPVKPEPTNQPTSIRISTWITTSLIPIIWNASITGDQAPDGYLVKLSTSEISDPIDGIDTGNGSTSIISGEATFKTTGTGASFYNAEPGKMYTIKIFAYTNTGTFIDYNTNSAPTFSVATQPNEASSCEFVPTGISTANISWEKPIGYDDANHSTLVFVKTTNPISTGSPSYAPSFYTANTQFGTGSVYQNDVLATCVYNSDGTNVSISGLSTNTMYHVLIYTVVDATNSNLKNAYSSATSTNGTTNNLSAPIATAATNNTDNGFTANWDETVGGTSYQLDVYTKSHATETEAFDGIIPDGSDKISSAVYLPGWSVSSTGTSRQIYTSSGNYGISSPSLAFTTTGDYISTATYPFPINTFSFWSKDQKGNETSTSSIHIEGYNGSAWNTIEVLSNTDMVTASTITYDLIALGMTDIVKIKMSFTKDFGNLAIDDISVTNNGTVKSPITDSPFTGLTETSKVFSGMNANTPYYYTVKATDGTNTSETSNEIKNKYLSAATGSENWSSTTGWSGGEIPVPGAQLIINNNLTIDQDINASDITINPGGKLTINSGQTLTTETLNLNSDATGTATFIDNGITLATTANIQQYLTEGRNWYMSIPVTSANIGALISAESVVRWDEKNGSWATLAEDAELNPLQGFISVNTGSTGTITFSGTLNNGEKSIALTRTAGKAKEGFNLVGNPYPSYLNWTAAIATAAQTFPTIWFRTKFADSYAFHTYNALGELGIPEGTSGEIPPMQAFWVRTTENGSTLAFNNSMRSHGSGSNLLKAPANRNPEQKVLRLQVSNGVNSDETILYFNADASDVLDKYDSPKMSNNNANLPEIFTAIENVELSINGMNNYTLNSEIPLGFRTGKPNEFSIKATEIRNFDSNIRIFLKDNIENTETDITNDLPYNFESDAETSASRFDIIFRTADVTTNKHDMREQNIWIAKNAKNQIAVNLNEAGDNCQITIFNAIGQKVTIKDTSDQLTIIDTPLKSGVYFVTVNNMGKNITKKIIIN